jgi:hypothetical protein
MLSKFANKSAQKSSIFGMVQKQEILGNTKQSGGLWFERV